MSEWLGDHVDIGAAAFYGIVILVIGVTALIHWINKRNGG